MQNMYVFRIYSHCFSVKYVNNDNNNDELCSHIKSRCERLCVLTSFWIFISIFFPQRNL